VTAIRSAQAEDAAGIARVYVETWRETYAGALPARFLVGLSESRQRALWRRQLEVRGARDFTIVASEEGASEGGVIGFLLAGHARRPAGMDTAERCGEVYMLYVDLDHQSRGIGRALMTRAFAGLANRGHKQVLVWVLEANPARFFYEAMGGRIVARRQERFAGANVAEVAYGWDDVMAEPRIFPR